MADEVQTFKALITIHKVLQEGHPISVKEAQQNVNWIESLARGVTGEGLRGTCFMTYEPPMCFSYCGGLYRCFRLWQLPDRFLGYGPLIRDYVFFLLAKLAFHRQHPEFNGLFEYEEYISLKSINDPNEGYVRC